MNMVLLEEIQIPNTFYNKVHKTGSSYTCNPPVENTDVDFIIYTKHPKELLHWLDQQKFCPHNSDYPLEITGLFTSLKKENINLIITDQEKFYELFLTATQLAKKLNLLDKQQRITLFQYILYNKLEDETIIF